MLLFSLLFSLTPSAATTTAMDGLSVEALWVDADGPTMSVRVRNLSAEDAYGFWLDAYEEPANFSDFGTDYAWIDFLLEGVNIAIQLVAYPMLQLGVSEGIRKWDQQMGKKDVAKPAAAPAPAAEPEAAAPAAEAAAPAAEAAAPAVKAEEETDSWL